MCKKLGTMALPQVTFDKVFNNIRKGFGEFKRIQKGLEVLSNMFVLPHHIQTRLGYQMPVPYITDMQKPLVGFRNNIAIAKPVEVCGGVESDCGIAFMPPTDLPLCWVWVFSGQLSCCFPIFVKAVK